jgi:hypothetical protein
MNVTFEPKTHTYWRTDGERVHSVTEILDYVYRPYANVPSDLLADAAERGKAVDRWVTEQLEAYMRTRIIRAAESDSLPSLKKWEYLATYRAVPLAEQYAAYGEAAIKWLDRVRFRPISVQQIVYSETYGYAGTADAIGDIGNQTAVIDWKTCGVTPVAAQQVAAYAAALGIKTGIIVQLKPNGSFETFTLCGRSMARARAAWMATLAVYQMQRETPRWFQDIPRDVTGGHERCLMK